MDQKFEILKQTFPRLRSADLKRSLTSSDMARILEVSDSTIRRWVRDGRLPAWETPGGHTRFRWSQVAERLDLLGMDKAS